MIMKNMQKDHITYIVPEVVGIGLPPQKLIKTGGVLVHRKARLW